MAISASIITQQIRSASPSLKGTVWLTLTSAIGKAIHPWILSPSNVQLQGVAVGVLGAGSVPTGKVTVAPMIGAMRASFVANGLQGSDGMKMAGGIAKGVANAINASGEYYGVSAGVGNGVDTCKTVMANAKTLESQLKASFVSVGYTGADSLKLAKAISVGVSSILLTGVGTGAVVGSPSPIPSSGTTILYMR